MIHETAMDGKGIFNLDIVQKFFKKMKVPLDQIKVKGDFFDFKNLGSVEEKRNCFNFIICIGVSHTLL
jgi:hypothetical protein